MALCSDVEVEVSPLIGSDWLSVIVVVFFQIVTLGEGRQPTPIH